MIYRRTMWLALFAVALLGTACDAQSDAQPVSEYVISSDPELAALASEILPDVAARAGMALTRPVRLEVRTSEELERYLVSKLDEDLPEWEAEARVDVYSALGLVDPETDLRALLLSLYGEQVAGFYEPDSTAFFIIDGQQEMGLRPLLAHELVHAVQDQSVDLSSLMDPAVGNDRASAAMAVIEGQATLVMIEYMTEYSTGQPANLGAIADFEEQVRPTLEMAAQFPALASAPRVIRESLLFPYVDGAIFLHGQWTGDDRGSPFGEGMPTSTEQILDPSAAPPIAVSLTLEGVTSVLTDELGRLELGIMSEDVLNAPDGPYLDGWAGDRYVLAENEAGVRTLAYVVLWDDRSDHESFAAAVERSADAFGGPVHVEYHEVDGVPTTLLQIGPPVQVRVEIVSSP